MSSPTPSLPPLPPPMPPKRDAKQSFWKAERWARVRLGLIFVGIGLVLTVGTLVWAERRGGGTYLVAWGPLVFGLIQVAVGWFNDIDE